MVDFLSCRNVVSSFPRTQRNVSEIHTSSECDFPLNISSAFKTSHAKKAQAAGNCQQGHPLLLIESIEPDPGVMQHRLERIANLAHYDYLSVVQAG